jgi:hypothetical protein
VASSKLSTITIVLVILLAVFVTTNHAAIREASVTTEQPSVKGDLKVFYELQTGTGEKATTASEVPCTAIEFHPEYLVLKFKASGGRIIPISQISSFRWEGK